MGLGGVDGATVIGDVIVIRLCWHFNFLSRRKYLQLPHFLKQAAAAAEDVGGLCRCRHRHLAKNRETSRF